MFVHRPRWLCYDVMLRMKYLYLIILVSLFSSCKQSDKEAQINTESKKLNSSLEVVKAVIPYNKLTKGISSEEIKSLMGIPERVGTTAFGDLQWTYPNSECPADRDEKYRKIWVVFDKDSKVKETHQVKVCWLTD